MADRITTFFFFLYFVSTSGSTPEQVHTLFGNSALSRVISWLTIEATPAGAESTVWYGLSPTLDLTQTGTNVVWTSGDINRTTHYVHLESLPIGSTVFYQVGSQYPNGTVFGNISEVFQMEIFDPWSLPISFISNGDIGTIPNNPSYTLDSTNLMEYLMKIGARFALQEGDMAYNLYNDNATRGDKFLNSLQNITSKIPYMPTAGNHELDINDDFLNYDNRFVGLNITASSSSSPYLHYYSWNYGPIHFATIDTDAIIYADRIEWLKEMLQPEFDWIENDLKNVNRSITPWVIVYYHHSMYCTARDGDSDVINPLECIQEPDELRGHSTSHGFEELYLNMGVDLLLVGHTHHYERTYPVYNEITVQKDYNNPKAPIHVVSGYPMAGGGYDPFTTQTFDWIAYRDMEYTVGVNLITVQNNTHLRIQFYRADNFSVMDDVWIIQNNHGPFPYPPEESNDNNTKIIVGVVVGVVCVIILCLLGYWLHKTGRCQFYKEEDYSFKQIDDVER